MKIQKVFSRKNLGKKPTLTEGVTVLATGGSTGVFTGAVASGILGAALGSSVIPFVGTAVGALVGAGIVLFDRVREEEVAERKPYTYTNSAGTTYILHGENRVLSTGKTSTLYFFEKEVQEGVLDKLPDGKVIEETNSGQPVVVNISGD